MYKLNKNKERKLDVDADCHFENKKCYFKNSFFYGRYSRVWNRYDKKRKNSNIKCVQTLSTERVFTGITVNYNGRVEKILLDAFEIHLYATSKAKRIINKNLTQRGYKPNDNTIKI